jgi:hypothetical protein
MPSRMQFPPHAPGDNLVVIAGIDVDPRAVIIRIRGLKTGVNLDVKEATGLNFASITHQGRKLGRWMMEFVAGHASGEEFTAENGFDVLCGFAELAYKAGGAVVKGSSSGGVNSTTRAATPIAIRHQLLAMAKIDAMVVEEIGWPEEQDDKSYVMSWSCIQYAPGQKITVTYPMQGDVLNGVSDNFSGAKGAAPASATSPQLPAPPPPPPSAGKLKP